MRDAILDRLADGPAYIRELHDIDPDARDRVHELMDDGVIMWTGPKQVGLSETAAKGILVMLEAGPATVVEIKNRWSAGCGKVIRKLLDSGEIQWYSQGMFCLPGQRPEDIDK